MAEQQQSMDGAAVTGEFAGGSVLRCGFLRAVGAGAALLSAAAGQAAGQQSGRRPDGDGRGRTRGGDGENQGGRIREDGALVATLSGDEEVPTVETAGSGSVRFAPTDDGGLDYRLAVQDVDGITQAHVHEGIAGTNGPIVADLLIATGNPDGTGGGEPLDATADEPVVEEGAITDADLAERIVERPGRFYVNVHTVANPPGEVRGQIRHESAVQFTVRVENVSAVDALAPSDGSEQPVPLSPGVFAVHSAIGPLFTPGLPDRGTGWRPSPRTATPRP